MSNVDCFDKEGNLVSVPADGVTFRPAVYGIFIEDDHILLLSDPQTGLLFPPGRILNPGDTPLQAIRQDYRRLTGVTPLVGPLLFVEEQYRLDEHGRAWRLSAMYYALERPSTAALTFHVEEDGPQLDMYLLDKLQRHQLQFGYEAIQAGVLRLSRALNSL